MKVTYPIIKKIDVNGTRVDLVQQRPGEEVAAKIYSTQDDKGDEKGTAIYRYLRSEGFLSPGFLSA